MKVLHLNTSYGGTGSGKGVAWLHQAMKEAGVESNVLVSGQKATDQTLLIPQSNLSKKFTRLLYKLDKFPLKLYRNKVSHTSFSPAWISRNIQHEIDRINPDLINLHWVCGGFVKPEQIATWNKPLVWTLRDMWAFTGGCHYDRNCNKYQSSCGACPILGSQNDNDISKQLWQRKAKSWQGINLTLIVISNWLADCARKSSLFKDSRIEVVHNALDASKFKPMPKNQVRELLGLDLTHNLVLFGALNATGDPRKGFQYITPALQDLAKSSLAGNTELVVFGSSEPENAPDIGMKVTYLGRVNDETKLAQIYAAADVTLVPSVQEAFGKVAIESLACGTPVVSFDSTGLTDIIEHQKNGYRATCFSSEDLAKGILWVLEDEERWQTLSHRARQKVEEEFTLPIQAAAYIKIYEDILQNLT
ncbi:MAG: glycosyltransferase [Planktothrix sp.]